jgi:protein-disulfide isomerase
MLRKIFSIVLVVIFMAAVSIFVYKNSRQTQGITKNLTEPNVVASASPEVVPEQKPVSAQELEAVIKEYIVNHPEDIIASLEGMQQKKLQASAAQAQEYLQKNRGSIETADNPPVLGSMDADVSIVVFYDYACSFCKKANEYTNEVIKQDQGVKIILRPIAVLGEPSILASKVALAVHKISPIKFNMVHNDLMNMRVINESAIKKLMEQHEIDYSLVENELNSYSVKQQVNRNFEFAKGLVIQGTPSYVINGQFVPGMLPVEKLQAIIAQIRSEKPIATVEEKIVEPKAEEAVEESSDSKEE